MTEAQITAELTKLIESKPKLSQSVLATAIEGDTIILLIREGAEDAIKKSMPPTFKGKEVAYTELDPSIDLDSSDYE